MKPFGPGAPRTQLEGILPYRAAGDVVVEAMVKLARALEAAQGLGERG